jgi:hypothetical protein
MISSKSLKLDASTLSMASAIYFSRIVGRHQNANQWSRHYVKRGLSGRIAPPRSFANQMNPYLDIPKLTRAQGRKLKIFSWPKRN